MADNILPFPRLHRGDPDPRRMALPSVGFRWREGAWRRAWIGRMSDVTSRIMRRRRRSRG